MQFRDNFYFILDSTPCSFPVPLDEQQATNYLTIILDKDFLYNNIDCYDILDYEKIIYIENKFNNNNKIQDLISKIKENIAYAYELKNKYRNRILDIPNSQIELNTEQNHQKGYYGIPDKFR